MGNPIELDAHALKEALDIVDTYVHAYRLDAHTH